MLMIFFVLFSCFLFSFESNKQNINNIADGGFSNEIGGNIKGDIDEIGGGRGEIRGDIKGNVDEIRGNRGDIKGNVDEIRGNRGDIKGNIDEIRGNRGDIKGNTDEIGGDRGEIKWNIDEIGGDRGEIKWNIDEIRGNVDEIKKNIELIFDKDHYSNNYSNEIIASKKSPIDHFLSEGLAKNYTLNDWFDINRYKEIFKTKTENHPVLDWLGEGSGLNCQLTMKRKQKVIVNMTSWPPRKKIVWLAIESLMRQNLKPDRIILWLSDKEFTNENSIIAIHPSLEILQKRGLEVKFCENYKSYKKFFPFLEEEIKNNGNNLIVTADDDIIFRKDWLECLYNEYLKSPAKIHAYYVLNTNIKILNRILKNDKLENGVYGPIAAIGNCNTEKFYRICTGQGVIFSIEHFKCIGLDSINLNKALELSPTEDDMWFSVLVYITSRTINKIGIGKGNFDYLSENYDSSALRCINNGLQNIRCFCNLLKYHKVKLLDENSLNIFFQKYGDKF